MIAEHLELDWHQARTDARLGEIDIGGWSGRLYYRADRRRDRRRSSISQPPCSAGARRAATDL